MNFKHSIFSPRHENDNVNFAEFTHAFRECTWRYKHKQIGCAIINNITLKNRSRTWRVARFAHNNNWHLYCADRCFSILDCIELGDVLQTLVTCIQKWCSQNFK